jgi:2'-5' RNA ligase
MEIRSFLAFELPPYIKKNVAQVSGEIQKSGLNVRWIKVDNIHLTVVFMGNMDSEVLKAIGDDMMKVCARYGAFHISLNGMGFFPNRRRPRVIWLGLDGDLERMSHFRDDLQKQVIPFGVKEEKRPFKPHLTLGRFRKSRQTEIQLDEFLMKYGDLKSPVCPLDELILFKSDLKPGGALYTKLASWPLSGKA